MVYLAAAPSWHADTAGQDQFGALSGNSSLKKKKWEVGLGGSQSLYRRGKEARSSLKWLRSKPCISSACGMQLCMLLARGSLWMLPPIPNLLPWVYLSIWCLEQGGGFDFGGQEATKEKEELSKPKPLLFVQTKVRFGGPLDASPRKNEKKQDCAKWVNRSYYFKTYISNRERDAQTYIHVREIDTERLNGFSITMVPKSSLWLTHIQLN